MKFSKAELELIKSLVANGKTQEVAEKEVIAMREAINEDEVVLTAEAVEAIGKSVSESIKPMIKAEVDASLKTFKEENEKIINKNVGGGVNKLRGTVDKSEIEKMPKEIKFMKQVQALMNKDFDSLDSYNQSAMEVRQKAGYANETVNADGGYVILLPEFEAEVEKLIPNYGVASQDATVRFIQSNSIKTNKRGTTVSLYEVLSEGGQKQGTKMTINQVTATLREFAAIAIATNRLIEDEAIDFWGEVTEGFAEAKAKLMDDLVFNDNNATYPGIIFTPGVNVVGVGAAIASITWDHLMNAESKLPTVAQANKKFYMHRTIYNILSQVKDSNGRYQFIPNGGLVTPWGTPIVLSDSLPPVSFVPDANVGYIVVGDLKRTKLYMKKGLYLEQSNEATVHDSDGNAVNLWEKNMQALKAEIRAVNITKFPEAFTVIGTGSVS